MGRGLRGTKAVDKAWKHQQDWRNSGGGEHHRDPGRGRWPRAPTAAGIDGADDRECRHRHPDGSRDAVNRCAECRTDPQHQRDSGLRGHGSKQPPGRAKGALAGGDDQRSPGEGPQHRQRHVAQRVCYGKGRIIKELVPAVARARGRCTDCRRPWGETASGKNLLAPNHEIGIKLGENLVRQVDVLPLVEPGVIPAEPLLVDPLGRQLPGHRVGRAALCWNHHQKTSGPLVQEPICLADRGGQIWKMLENVDGDHAVEEPIRKIQALLAIAQDRLDARKGLADLGRHVLAKLVGVIVRQLLGGQHLVAEVLTETSPQLKRPHERRRRVLDRESVVEGLDLVEP